MTSVQFNRQMQYSILTEMMRLFRENEADLSRINQAQMRTMVRDLATYEDRIAVSSRQTHYSSMTPAIISAITTAIGRGGVETDPLVQSLMSMFGSAGFQEDVEVPLPQDVIDSLRRSTHHEDPTTHDMCSICQQYYEEGETIVYTKCDHAFHTQCITTWFQSHPTCPVCRRDQRE